MSNSSIPTLVIIAEQKTMKEKTIAELEERKEKLMDDTFDEILTCYAQGENYSGDYLAGRLMTRNFDD